MAFCAARWITKGQNEMNRVLKPDSKGSVSVAKMLRSGYLGVRKTEWKEISSSFSTVEAGSSIAMDWAIVSKKTGGHV